eukprot:gene12859-biopygen8182
MGEVVYYSSREWGSRSILTSRPAGEWISKGLGHNNSGQFSQFSSVSSVQFRSVIGMSDPARITAVQFSSVQFNQFSQSVSQPVSDSVKHARVARFIPFCAESARVTAVECKLATFHQADVETKCDVETFRADSPPSGRRRNEKSDLRKPVSTGTQCFY